MQSTRVFDIIMLCDSSTNVWLCNGDKVLEDFKVGEMRVSDFDKHKNLMLKPVKSISWYHMENTIALEIE